MIAHIVFFSPKPGLGKSDLRSFAQSFQDVCRQIPSIRRARIGPILELTAAPEPKVGVKTYSVAAWLEFDDGDGLEEYLKHPSHEVLGKLFWKYCGSTLVANVDMADPLKDRVGDVFGL
ncbi:MAG TPA: Dabb family protein [Vicinamibacterales bacterium]|nr:Dabb family protein [Vicinamibacterales bacterium]